MNNDEELSKYMILMEQYKEQINQLELQYQYLNAALNEYQKAKLTIDKLEKTKNQTDSLIPIGGGVYLNAVIKDTSNVLFDIGAGIISKKKINDAITKIDERIENINKNMEKVNSMLQQFQKEVEEIRNKAQQLSSEESE
ncbi:MAG: prefoldin subunit alpha [Atribacterota bacterium]